MVNSSSLEESKDSDSIKNEQISPGKNSIKEEQEQSIQVKDEKSIDSNEIIQQNEVQDMIITALEDEPKELNEDEKREEIKNVLQKLDEIEGNIIILEQRIDELAAVIF